MRSKGSDEIQDFLDGRMSGEQRAAFEQRLRGEPDLARRLNDYREIGRQLRDERPALSPGFYTRARARFEAEAAGPRRAWRLLSWEAAGLSAAVLLAAAIFLPGLLRHDETLAPPSATPPAAVDELRDDDDRADSEESVTSAQEKGDVGDSRSTDDVAPASTEGKAEKSRVAEEEFAPVPERREAAEAREKSVGQAVAGAPLAEPESAGRGLADELETPPPVVETVTLGADALEPGALRIVGEQTWRQLAQRKDKKLQQRSAAPSVEADLAETRRVVLIGPREGLLDCSVVEIEVRPDAYVVRLPMGQGRAGPGCAVILPRDGREIRIPEPGVDG